MSDDPCILSTGGNGASHLWNLRSANPLATYRENECVPQSVSIVPPAGGTIAVTASHFIAAHRSKPSVLMWNFSRDAPAYKCAMPEMMTCTAAHPSGGQYLFAGGQSGRLYVWEGGSGELLRSWNGHYKAVSSLCISPCGSMLISGGGDSLIHVWDIASAVDVLGRGDLSAPPVPCQTWSEHSLPITFCGFASGGGGWGAAARLYTSSADGTVRLWSLATGHAIHKVQLPSPVLRVAVTAAESRLFAACSDGSVYSIDLHLSVIAARAPAAHISVVGGGGGLAFTGSQRALASTASSSSSALSPAVSTLAAGASSSSSSSATAAAFLGHVGPVTCLALSPDEDVLITGGDDGSIRLWDIPSRQQLYKYDAHRGGAVASLTLMARPPNTIAASSWGASSNSSSSSSSTGSSSSISSPSNSVGSHAVPSLSRPLAPLKKHQLAIPADWRGSTTGPTNADDLLVLSVQRTPEAELDLLEQGMQAALHQIYLKTALDSALSATTIVLEASAAAMRQTAANAASAAGSSGIALGDMAMTSSNSAANTSSSLSTAERAELESLRAKVSTLENENARWKLVNNALLSKAK